MKRAESMFNLELRKERDNIRRFNLEKNLEREKRKMEWKKLNVLAKEQMAREKVNFLRFEDEKIRQSTAVLTMRQHQDKDEMRKTLDTVKRHGIMDKNT